MARSWDMTAHHSRRLLFGLLCLTTTSPSPPRPHLLLTTTSSPLLAQLRLFFSRSTSSSSSSWSHRRPYLQQQQQQQLVVVSAASFLLRPTFYHPLVRNRNNNRIPLVWGITSRIPSTIHNNNNNIVVNLTTRRKTTSLLTTTSLNAMKPKKFYAVAIGRTTGIFDTWNDCQAQVSGYSGARFKSFKNREEAQQFINTIQATLDTTSASTTGGSEGSKKRLRIDNDADSDKNDKNKNNNNNNSPEIPQPRPNQCLHVKMEVMFDGGSRGNPGVAGAGAVVTCQQTQLMQVMSTTPTTQLVWYNRRVTKLRDYLGIRQTNNQAEYQGLCIGLKQAMDDLYHIIAETTTASTTTTTELTNKEAMSIEFKVDCVVQGDSQLVINQVNGEYVCRNNGLKPYLSRVQEYVKSMANPHTFGGGDGDDNKNNHKNNIVISVNTRFEHVLREFNSVADALGNEAMDAKRTWTTVTVDGVDQPVEE